MKDLTISAKEKKITGMIGKANDKSKKIVNNLKISTNNSFKTKSDVYSND